MLVILVVLTATFFLLTFYGILQANFELLPNQVARFVILKILDTSTAASLFVTLLGALVVRHQFALSLLPRINYKSSNSSKRDAGDTNISFDTWRVEMINSGLGAAVVNSTKYTLELSGEKAFRTVGNHSELVEVFSQLGLSRGVDYWLENITTGFALSPKENCPVFEIKTDYLARIVRLDLDLRFQDQLGGRYRRDIFLIPQSANQQKNVTAQV